MPVEKQRPCMGVTEILEKTRESRFNVVDADGWLMQVRMQGERPDYLATLLSFKLNSLGMQVHEPDPVAFVEAMRPKASDYFKGITGGVASRIAGKMGADLEAAVLPQTVALVAMQEIVDGAKLMGVEARKFKEQLYVHLGGVDHAKISRE